MTDEFKPESPPVVREMVITRCGRPVARLVSYEAAPAPLLGHLAGSVTRYGDLVSPVDEAWEADA